MNRIITIIILMLLALGLSAAEITIISVTGKVQISANGSTWTDVSGGEVIATGTMISTGFRSTATLSTGDAEIEVAQLTRITIEELLEQDDLVTTSLFISGGRINAEVSRERVQHDFTVSSPVATASVRGTGFSFDGRSLEVEHGAVLFSTSQGRVLAVQGEALRALQDGSPQTALQNMAEDVEITAVLTLLPGEDLGDLVGDMVEEIIDLGSQEELEEIIEEITEIVGTVDFNVSVE